MIINLNAALGIPDANGSANIDLPEHARAKLPPMRSRGGLKRWIDSLPDGAVMFGLAPDHNGHLVIYRVTKRGGRFQGDDALLASIAA